MYVESSLTVIICQANVGSRSNINTYFWIFAVKFHGCGMVWINFTFPEPENATYTTQDACRLEAAMFSFLGNVTRHHVCSEGEGESQQGGVRESVGYMEHGLTYIIRLAGRVKLGTCDGHTGAYEWPVSTTRFFEVGCNTTYIRGN